jgi:acyl-CoA thioesterase
MFDADFRSSRLSRCAFYGRVVKRLTFEDLTRVRTGSGDVVMAELTPAIRGAYYGIHGGYFAGIALNALLTRIPVEHRPRSFSVQFLRAGKVGPISLSLRIDHQGRSSTISSVRAVQDGNTVAVGHCVFGVTDPGRPSGGMRAPRASPPGIGAVVIEAAPWLGIEYRTAELHVTEDANVAWMRLSEDRVPDELSLMVLIDGMFPAMFRGTGGELMAPTVELSVQFGDVKAAAASPWVLGIFRNRQSGNGWAVEDGELWTPSGSLAMSSRQLRRVLPSSADQAGPAGVTKRGEGDQ